FCAGTVRADDGAKAEKHLKHREKRFKKIDANSDGAITLAELTAWRTAHQKHAHKNLEKHVSKHFSKMDSNGDGKVTLEEFTAFRAAHPHKHGKKHDKE